MEPKGKAIELVKKFRPYVDSEIAGETDFEYSKEQETSMSKKCALIAVDEILKIEMLHRKIQWAEWNNVQPESSVEFWELVKSEIEKL